MKTTIFSLIFLLIFSFTSQAQTLSSLDESPMDMAYFPHNFAHDRKEGQKAIIRAIYSRPAKKGREIFGKLVPYGEIWRAGANEATEIKFYKDLEFGGKKVKAGTYSLFTIPGQNEWTIILNNELDYWGAYSYKANNDAVRVTAKPTKANDTVENFTIQFESKGGNKGVMKLAWEQTLVEVPFTY